ncbi:pilin [Entomomonas asaccharolytica]|uniref:Pilin n=1 Tax=Entomomonas asaccharolytica TaxID=2785331 RepID=A0A974NDM4_9GAMM|nr:pilin [Entomomonas asaccharolytica]QQP84670.1 pilin [Entomomonas asaccharolytica]
MKKLIAIASLVFGVQFATATETNPKPSLEEHQAAMGFLLAQEIVEAGRYFYKLYAECPTSLKDIGLENINQLTANLLADATIDENCYVTVNYANHAPVAAALQGKKLTIKPNTKELNALAGECSFDGPAVLAPPKDCKSQAFPYLTEDDTHVIDGFIRAYRTHNPALLKADALNELSSLILLPKMMVAQYYGEHKSCPTNNQMLGLSAPEELSVRFLKGIEVSGCDITATYKDSAPLPEQFRNKTITYSLQTNANNQQSTTSDADWLCQSDLEQGDLPKDCQTE